MKKQRDRHIAGVRIERACEADVERMTELLGELFGIEHDFAARPERQAAGLRLLLARAGDAAVFVAREGERVIGMICAQLVVSTAEGAPSAWVEDVIVDAAARGRGIGRALLDAVIGWAQAAGATRAQLLIDTENAPAESFYARLGWEKTQLATRRLPLK